MGHQDFFENPFLSQPLPYAEINGIGTSSPAQISAASITSRALSGRPSFFDLNQSGWAAPVWGPSYIPGITIFGQSGKWNYAAEMKTSGLSAAPEEWDFNHLNLQHPAFAARIGYQPDAAWDLGLSFATGPYLSHESVKFLPIGVSRGDLSYRTAGLDVRWAHRNLIISGELLYSAYDTLEVGTLESLNWYLQARWKISPRFSLAARVGQTLNNDANVAGTDTPWSPDLLRAELGFGWRIQPDLLFKAQYTYTKATGGLEGPAQDLFGAGISWRF